MQLAIGSLLQGGKYRIERVLGQGGFGITYVATDTLLDKKICIKEFFMKEYCNRDADASHISVVSEGAREQVERYKAKFVKEAGLISSMRNPHIITIYDIFTDNDTAYYTMDYLEGGTLKTFVEANGPMEEASALKYIGQIGNALKYMHERKVMHLDVKPSNIMLDSRGNAVLIDFGISKRYGQGGEQTSSTPVGISKGYAPMEQYDASGVSSFSPETDIYSLGATLYFLLVGMSPKEATIINEDGIGELPSSISRKVRHAIVHAMRPRRKERPHGMPAFLDELGIEQKKPEKTATGKRKDGSRPDGFGLSAYHWLLWAVFPMLWWYDRKRSNKSLKPWQVVLNPILVLVIYPWFAFEYCQSLMFFDAEDFFFWFFAWGTVALFLITAVVFTIYLWREIERLKLSMIYFAVNVICCIPTFSLTSFVTFTIYNLGLFAIMLGYRLTHKEFTQEAYDSANKWLIRVNTICVPGVLFLFIVFIVLLFSGVEEEEFI